MRKLNFHILWISAIVFIVVSCNEKDIEHCGPSIRFAAEYENPENELNGEVTNTYTIPDFRVSAFRNSQWGAETLMDNIVVTRTGINSWIYSPPVDWPEDESVDFFAVSPARIEIQNNQWWYHTFRYENQDCSTDLLVSVRRGVFQTSGRIKLNFRHALARVAIFLKNSNPDYSIGIKEVELCNFPKFGTFYFPTNTTSPETNSGELFTNWDYYSAQDKITLFSASTGNVMNIDQYPMLTGPKNLFMIPFNLTKLEGEIIWEGTHVMVRYLVDGNEREIRIPLYQSTPESKWLPGVSYQYTIDLNPEISSTRNVQNLQTEYLTTKNY